jgi:hypothetical protein
VFVEVVVQALPFLETRPRARQGKQGSPQGSVFSVLLFGWVLVGWCDRD